MNKLPFLLVELFIEVFVVLEMLKINTLDIYQLLQ